MQAFLILSGALLISTLLGITPTIRAWWRALLSRPQPAVLLIIAVASTMLGSGEGVDLARLESHLPDSIRILRVIIYVSLFTVSIGGIINEPKCFNLSGRGTQWMIVYALFAMGSAIYSLNPLMSLWKGFEVLTLVLFTINLAGQLRTIEDTRWLLDVSGLISLFMVSTVLVGIIFYPGEALRHVDPVTGEGYFGSRGLVPVMNPATQGIFAALLALLTIIPLLSRHKKSLRDKVNPGLLVVISAAFCLMFLARSRTQMFAFVFSLMLALIFSRRRLLATMTALAVTVIIVTSDTVLKFIYRGQTEEQFTSFTGRINAWEYFLSNLDDSMLFGKGFYATQKLLFGSGSVDNTYLEAFVGLGSIGLILLLIPIFSAGFALVKTRPKSNKFELEDTLWLQAMACFTLLTIRGFASPTFASMHPMLVYYLIAHLSIASLLRLRVQQKNSAVMAEEIGQYLHSAPPNSFKLLMPRRPSDR